MPKLTTPLSDMQIKNAKPKDKDYTLTDGNGLQLLIKSSGTKLWEIRYTINGKRKKGSLGTYPNVALIKAREIAQMYQKMILDGIDPIEKKREQKTNRAEVEKAKEHTFEKLFYEWLEHKKGRIVESSYIKLKRTFENNFLPELGNRQVETITAKEYKELVLKMKDRGAESYAHKAKSMLSGFLKYLDEKDIIAAPSLVMNNTLPKPKETNLAHITNTKTLGQLLKAINEYSGDVSTKYALMFAPLVFVRPINIRFMEWSEVDFEKKIWRIPAEKMKMREPHIVPLSRQAVEILEDVYKFSGDCKLVFKSPISSSKPLSPNTINLAIKRLGFGDEMVSHGFRHTASTILHEHISEHGFHSEVIERQLAHAERNGVKAAYNHAEYIKERTALMQWWADFLDMLKK